MNEEGGDLKADSLMIKRLWHDPVWSKVIATIIIGGVLQLPAAFRFLLRTMCVPRWILGIFVLVATVIVLFFRKRWSNKPKITIVGEVSIPAQDMTGKTRLSAKMLRRIAKRFERMRRCADFRI